MPGPLLRFDGVILGAAFASGDRFVVGRWPRSPFGSFADVMWARPDGTRMLIAPAVEVLAFIDRHYAFDVARPGEVRVWLSRDRIVARCATIGLDLDLALDPPGVLSTLLALRPRRLRTARPWIALEDVLVRPVVGPLLGGSARIRARGRTRTGAREWYAIHDYRDARATARLGDRDLGPAVRATRSARFGFSEFPELPAAVRVTSLIER